MQIEIVALELKSRSARRHFQVRNLRERVEYFLGNAVAEVGGVLVIAQIFEWQNRDRFRRQRTCGRLALSRRLCSITTEEKESDGQDCTDDNDINPDIIFLFFCSRPPLLRFP